MSALPKSIPPDSDAGSLWIPDGENTDLVQLISFTAEINGQSKRKCLKIA